MCFGLGFGAGPSVSPTFVPFGRDAPACGEELVTTSFGSLWCLRGFGLCTVPSRQCAGWGRLGLIERLALELRHHTRRGSVQAPTVTVRDFDVVFPAVSVAVDVTVKRPARVNVCDTDEPIADPPSPKDHLVVNGGATVGDRSAE